MAENNYLKDELQGFVPTEQAQEIVKGIARGSSILRMSKVESMASEKKKIPVMTDGAGAYWVGEGERIKTTKAGWIFPEIVAKKLAVIIPVTKEKLKDTTINVFGELQETMAEAFYKAIDSACIFKTNSPFATSLMTSIEKTGQKVELETNGAGKIDLDVSDSMALVEEAGFDVNAFIARNGIKNSLRKLRDGNGNQLLATGLSGNEFYSQPIDFSRNKSWDKTKAEIIGGDFNYSLVGIRDGIEYEILKEATLQGTLDADGKPISLAEQDMVGIKVTMRLGYLVVKEEAFCAVVPKAGA